MQNRLAFKATLTRSFSEINTVFYPILLFRYNSLSNNYVVGWFPKRKTKWHYLCWSSSSDIHIC